MLSHLLDISFKSPLSKYIILYIPIYKDIFFNFASLFCDCLNWARIVYFISIFARIFVLKKALVSIVLQDRHTANITNN